MDVPLFDELAVIALLAVLVTVVLARLRLPTVAGLLLAGALLGPFGFALVTSQHAIEVLAEIGVVLLLFTIGLEFSIGRLRDIFRQVALGGLAQVGLTVAATAGCAVWFGLPLRTGLFYGFVFAMSSTAIVMRALADRRELDAPHGRFIVGTLVFQDLLVVPMVLVVPLLASETPLLGLLADAASALVTAGLVVAGMLGISRFVVPRFLALVEASRSREVFLLAILGLCIGTAWLTSLVGLSLALGAFLAGMVVADTEYGHRAMGDVLPLKDAFVSVFFVSLGMLFDVREPLSDPLRFFVLLAGFLGLKGVLAGIAAMLMRFPARVARLAGVGLAQFGEFGFVLAQLGADAHVIPKEDVSPLLTAGIASMFLTPLLVRIAPHISAGERLLAPLERLMRVRSIDEADQGTEALAQHVVVVGFGLAGRLSARTLASTGIPFVVLDLNAENVRAGRAEGLPVFYGDATSEEALGHAHLEKARLLVLLMNDPAAARRVVDTARRVAPSVPVMMRTRYLAEAEGLREGGAWDVVAEEVEGAVEMIARMLRRFETPRNTIDAQLDAVRGSTQQSQRKRTLPRNVLRETRGLDELKVESFVVQPGSRASGASPASMRLRSETGALVVGTRRGERLRENPDAQEPFADGDVVYLVGTSAAVRAAALWFSRAPT